MCVGEKHTHTVLSDRVSLAVIVLKLFFAYFKAEKYMRRLPRPCIQSAQFNSTQAGVALKWPPVPPPLTGKVP